LARLAEAPPAATGYDAAYQLPNDIWRLVAVFVANEATDDFMVTEGSLLVAAEASQEVAVQGHGRVDETLWTPAFREAMEHAPPPRMPLGRLLADHPGAVLAGTVGVIACFSLFYLATTFALSFATTTLGYPRETILAIQLAADVVFAIGIVVSGWWADKTSPRTVMAVGAGLTVLVGLGFGSGLGSGSLWLMFLTMASALFVMGLCYGPLGAWLPGLYAVPVRYTGISLAFNLGGIVGGALAPFGAAWLAEHGGVAWTGLVLSAAGVVTLAGVLLAPRRV
jgi:hypothetical protein